MQSAAGPGQPVISSCQREAESTRNLGGMRQGGRTGEREERGRSEGLSQHCVHNNCSERWAFCALRITVRLK